MIDFTSLLTLSYYIDTNPGGDFPLGIFCLVFFGIMLFIPGLLRAKAAGNKYLKKSIKKGLWKFLVLGGVGMILTLSRFGGVPVISMRLWLYLLVLLSVIFMLRRFRKMIMDYRKRLASVAREAGK